MIENKTMNEMYNSQIEEESWLPEKDKTSFHTPSELISNVDANHDKSFQIKNKKVSDKTT